MSWARQNQSVPVLEQWTRTLRWHQRLSKLFKPPFEESADDFADYFIACFQNLYFLRDWLLRSTIVKQQEVESLFGSLELRLCRDICNGTKHLIVDHPSVDGNFSMPREYVPKPLSGEPALQSRFLLCAAGKQYDLLDLSNRCVNLIGQFLSAKGFTQKTSESCW